jgi:hypothetical protein
MLRRILAIAAAIVLFALLASFAGAAPKQTSELYALTWPTPSVVLPGEVVTFSVERIKKRPAGPYPVRLMLVCGQQNLLVYGELKQVGSSPTPISGTVPNVPMVGGCLVWVYTETVVGQNPFYPESAFLAIAVG